MVTDSPFANKEPFTPEGEPTRRGLGVWTAKAVHSQGGPPLQGEPSPSQEVIGFHAELGDASQQRHARFLHRPLTWHKCAAVVLQARMLPVRLPPLAAK